MRGGNVITTLHIASTYHSSRYNIDRYDLEALDGAIRLYDRGSMNGHDVAVVFGETVRDAILAAGAAGLVLRVIAEIEAAT